ncbi:RNA polymerase sigma factor region1.1 domain-containing protein [Sabulicella glaciei]|uniref:RNA polymerase sigma factor 70 region 1.1 domain-containing protein n=1 Tax=Sabulicella glaciei TaxID=2984948 RepID=A0ABT3P098_9PROT|nr:RNA polymerase sigma factor region1.1 domain-containing protein [Roseococcus sp. MDT2-1-1]MCW8087837.1 hypothetical protein [Roseococcus sp. MDT2-1-1]
MMVFLNAESAALRRLMVAGKKRGYVTVGELNATLPSGVAHPELIEDTLAWFADEGIKVVEKGDGPEDGEAAPNGPRGPLSPAPLQCGAEAQLNSEANPALDTDRILPAT